MIVPHPHDRHRLARPTRRAASLLLIAVSVACSDDPPVAPADDEAVTSVDSVPLARVDGVARRLYELVAAGEDPSPVVREIVRPLLPVLEPGTQRTRIEQSLDAGDPVVPTTTIDAVSDALSRGHLVRLESFFIAARAKGAVDAATQTGLDAWQLGTHLALLRERDVVGRDELVPALIGALGRERVRRAGLAGGDPAWGDASLDPLQFLLLTYALHWASVPPLARTLGAPSARESIAPRLQLVGTSGWLAGDAAEFTPGRARRDVFDRIAEWTDFPVTAPQHASLCVPLVLFRHHFQATALNRTLGTNVVDTNRITGVITRGTTGGGAPQVELSLTAAFPGVDASARWLAERAGCAAPAAGPLAGRVVLAELDAHLPTFTTFTAASATTSAAGGWTGRLFAADDQVPGWLRVLQRTDSGTVHLSTSGLVAGWDALRLAVGSSIAAKLADRLVFRVNHWELPRELEVNMRVQYRWGQRPDTLDGHITGLLTGRLLLDPWSPMYQAAGREVLFNYATLGWEPRTAACMPSFGGLTAPLPMTVRLSDDLAPEEPAGITLQFARDLRGDLPRERLDEHCTGEGRDTHWFIHFWRLARRDAPIPLRGDHWSRPEPGVLTTNFGTASAANDGSNWWGEWVWIELRGMP